MNGGETGENKNMCCRDVVLVLLDNHSTNPADCKSGQYVHVWANFTTKLSSTINGQT